MVQALIDSGYEVEMAFTAQEATNKIEHTSYDLILTQLASPQIDGYDILKRAKAKNKTTIIIVITNKDESHAAFEAINCGAHGFIEKPFSSAQVILEVKGALEKRSLSYDLDYLRHQQDTIYEPENIVGESPQLRACLSTGLKVAKTDFTILLTGETGVGKELIAGLIHYTSLRKDKPFIKVNCAALPETLLESELFGHEKGAFTGAISQRIGRFEQANGGSLFLDEIGDMSLRTQAKVLRAIERKEFERVGGGRTIKVDIRFITASNKDLAKEVQEGNFREDLFYRLNVVSIRTPPLRERKEDIIPLANYFLRKCCGDLKKRCSSFSPEIHNYMLSYHWPGNIRELRNMVERAALFSDGEVIGMDGFLAGEPPPRPEKGAEKGIMPSLEGLTLREAERTLILSALERTNWVQKDAAEILGISKRVMNYKIRKHGIQNQRWRKAK
jgi:two-component system response regulator HydG